MCVCPVLGIPSSEAPPFPIPDVPISVYGTRLVAWVSFWALYYHLVPISPIPLAFIQDFIVTDLLLESFLLPN